MIPTIPGTFEKHREKHKVFYFVSSLSIFLVILWYAFRRDFVT